MKLSNIKNKKISEHIIVNSEVIRPVAEKWVDGLIHQTDNLQLCIQSVSKKVISDVSAYLYYYDESDNELGHEFDLTDELLPNQKARVSFMLIPPEKFSYAILELKADIEEKHYFWPKMTLLGLFILIIFAMEFYDSV